ncbi:S-adenosylmethionine transporter [Microbotryomycetes sp. JL201]|nr:S-adenosylmethionine transporter [Microbotryomycetes sp. JL201]
MSQLNETSFMSALVAGGMAGTAVDTLFFPIDTLKTRMQSSQGFWHAGGFTGVYRGLGSAVVGSAPGAAAFFTTYETLKQTLPRIAPALASDELAPALHMLSASGGEIAACLVRVPTEVVKQRSQTASKGTGSWAVAKSVWTAQGLAGFYRGFGSTVAREIPFTCLQFPLYERLKLFLARRRTQSGQVKDLPSIEAAACGSLAGGVAAGLTTPLDVCKTRIMLSGRTDMRPAADGSVARQYPYSLFKTLGIIYRQEGLRVLFSGVVPRVVWISAGGAVFLGVYEAAKKFLETR